MKSELWKRMGAIIVMSAMVMSGLVAVIPVVQANGGGTNVNTDNCADFGPVGSYINSTNYPHAKPLSKWAGNQVYPGDKNVSFSIDIRNIWPASALTNVWVNITDIKDASGSVVDVYFFWDQSQTTSGQTIGIGATATFSGFQFDVAGDTPPGVYNMSVKIEYSYSGAPGQQREIEWLLFDVDPLISVNNIWDYFGGPDMTVNMRANGEYDTVNIELLQDSDQWNNENSQAFGGFHNYNEIGRANLSLELPTGITGDPAWYELDPNTHWGETTTENFPFNLAVAENTPPGTYTANGTITYYKYYDDDIVHPVLGWKDQDLNDIICTEMFTINLYVEETRMFRITNIDTTEVNDGIREFVNITFKYIGNVPIDDATAILSSTNGWIANPNVPFETWVALGDLSYGDTTTAMFIVDVDSSSERGIDTWQINIDGWNGTIHLGVVDTHQFDMTVLVDPEITPLDTTWAPLDLPPETVPVYMDDNDVDLHMPLIGTGTPPNDDDYTWAVVSLEQNGTNPFPFEQSTIEFRSLWHVGDASDTTKPGQRAHTGDYALAFNKWDEANNEWNYHTEDMTSGFAVKEFDLTTSTVASIDFWSWYEVGIGETVNVEISTDGGLTWNTLFDITMDAPSTWIHHTKDLSAYLGNTVDVRFYFNTNDPLDNAHEGWYVDDIVFTDDTGTQTFDFESGAGGWEFYTEIFDQGTTGAPATVYFPDLSINTSLLSSGRTFDVLLHIIGRDKGTGVDVDYTIPLIFEIFDTRLNVGDAVPTTAPGIYPIDDNEISVPITNTLPPIQDPEPFGEVYLTLDSMWYGSSMQVTFDHNGEGGGHWLDAGNTGNAEYIGDIPQYQEPGIYTGNGTITGLTNAWEDTYFPSAWGDYPYPSGSYYDPDGDGVTFSYPVQLDMTVDYYANMTITQVTPTSVEYWTNGTNFQFTVKNTGNCKLFDVNVTWVDILDDNGASHPTYFENFSDSNNPPSTTYLWWELGDFETGEEKTFTLVANNTDLCLRGLYRFIFNWNAWYLDTGATGNPPSFVPANENIQTPKITVTRTMDLATSLPSFLPSAWGGAVWLFKDNSTDNVNVHIPVEITNNDNDLINLQATLAGGEGTPFVGATGADNTIQWLNNSESAVFWFNNTEFKKDVDAGWYNVTMTITSAEEVGSQIVEVNREYLVPIRVLGGPDVQDPTMFELYLHGLNNTVVLQDNIKNNEPLDILNLAATLDNGTLFKDVGTGTFSWNILNASASGNNFVTFTMEIADTATAGWYNLTMTLTGVMNMTSQPITRTYLWTFYVHESRIVVGDAEATDGDGLFYAGETFENLTITVKNTHGDGHYDPQLVENMTDVEVTISGLPNGVTLWGTPTATVDGIDADDDATFEWRIDIDRTVPPGIYPIDVQVVYYGDDGTQHTETFTVNFTVEYTPIVWVTAPSPYYVFDQGDVYMTFPVNFTNMGNIDLINVTFTADIFNWFAGSGFFWVESSGNLYNVLSDYQLNVPNLAVGETVTTWFTLTCQPNIPFGDWRIGIDVDGWYYDEGATGNLPSMYRSFESKYAPEGYFPFNGTYIPLYATFIPEFVVEVISGPVFLDGQTEDVPVEIEFEDVESEAPIFEDIELTIHGGEVFAGDYIVDFGDGQNVFDNTSLTTPGPSITGWIYADLIATEEGTYWLEWTATCTDPVHSLDLTTSGYLDVEVKHPEIDISLNAGSDPLRLGGSIIDLDLMVGITNKEATTTFEDVAVDMTVGPSQPIVFAGNESVETKTVDVPDIMPGFKETATFNVDLKEDAEPGTYLIPVSFYGVSEKSGQWVRLGTTVEVRVYPFPPRVVVADLACDDIIPGREFNVTFTIRNDGGDDARDIYVNIFALSYENLEAQELQYVFLDNFLSSISARYYEDNQIVDVAYLTDNNVNISSPGYIDIRYQNTTLDDLGIHSTEDMVNASLNRERMLSSPQPVIDQLYISRIGAGDSVELTFTFYADAKMVQYKPYQIDVDIDWKDSEGNWDFETYTTTVHTVSAPLPTPVSEYAKYIIAAVVLLVILLLLVLLIIYILSPKGIKKKAEETEEEVPKEEEEEEEWPEEEEEEWPKEEEEVPEEKEEPVEEKEETPEEKEL